MHPRKSATKLVPSHENWENLLPSMKTATNLDPQTKTVSTVVRLNIGANLEFWQCTNFIFILLCTSRSLLCLAYFLYYSLEHPKEKNRIVPQNDHILLNGGFIHVIPNWWTPNCELLLLIFIFRNIYEGILPKTARNLLTPFPICRI